MIRNEHKFYRTNDFITKETDRHLVTTTSSRKSETHQHINVRHKRHLLLNHQRFKGTCVIWSRSVNANFSLGIPPSSSSTERSSSDSELHPCFNPAYRLPKLYAFRYLAACSLLLIADQSIAFLPVSFRKLSTTQNMMAYSSNDFLLITIK